MLHESVISSSSAVLRKVAGSIHGVRLAFLSTLDGFEIVSIQADSEKLPVDRISAMACSLMAIAKSAGNELGHNSCRRLIFETGSGAVVVQAVESNIPCFCGMVIDSEARLGHALWAINEIAMRLKINN